MYIYNYLVGQFMFWRWRDNNLLPGVFHSYFVINNTTHEYENRQRNYFVSQGPLLLIWFNFNPSMDM